MASIGYLPDLLCDRFAPHDRAYRAHDLRALLCGPDGAIITHTQIYPGYDKIARRSAWLARAARPHLFFRAARVGVEAFRGVEEKLTTESPENTGKILPTNFVRIRV